MIKYQVSSTKYQVLVCVAFALLMLTPFHAQAFKRLFYANYASTSAASFAAHADKVDIIAPQAFSFDRNGVVSGKIPPKILATAKAKNSKLMPLVTNGTFDAIVATRIVRNQRVQDYLISSLIAIAKAQGFVGWQLDIENMDASHRDRYSFFVEKAAREFKKNNLLLSVAVVSQISNNPADHPPQSWNEWAGVYDYTRIAKAVDFISIMAYDNPSTAGPTAPLPWVKQVVAHATSSVPTAKISLGIPNFHWEWTVNKSFRVSSGGYRYVSNLLDDSKNPRGYDEKLGVPWVKYQTKRGDWRIVWYEDARSMGEKIQFAKTSGLAGFSMWVLGLEDPALWDTL